jgi:hypothetical protein
MSMNAHFNPSTKRSFQVHHRKEHGTCEQRTVLDLEDLKTDDASCRIYSEPIILRLYWKEVCAYACLWVHSRTALDASGSTLDLASAAGTTSLQGSGRAGGYGYHKSSAAAHDAIVNAGFVLSERIDGRGDSAVNDALLAIARCIGLKRPGILIAHN